MGLLSAKIIFSCAGLGVLYIQRAIVARIMEICTHCDEEFADVQAASPQRVLFKLYAFSSVCFTMVSAQSVGQRGGRGILQGVQTY